MKEPVRRQKGVPPKARPKRTSLQDAAASQPEVRPEDVIPPYVPDRAQVIDREDRLPPEQLDAELDYGIAGSFPASDPPSIVSPKRPPDRDKKPEEEEDEK